MSAVLLVVCGFFLGLFFGVVVGSTTRFAAEYHDEQADQDAHRDDLVRAWREGQTYGKREGYVKGWTSGRRALVDEQAAKAHHPTSHPLGEVVRIEHLRKDELDDLWGED
jgi:hypothetical protein